VDTTKDRAPSFENEAKIIQEKYETLDTFLPVPLQVKLQ